MLNVCEKLAWAIPLLCLTACELQIRPSSRAGARVLQSPEVFGLKLLSADRSSVTPTFQAAGLATGDIVSLLRDADSSCVGGDVIDTGTALPGNTHIALSGPGPGVTSATHQYRMKVVHADASVTCSDPIDYHFTPATYDLITLGNSFGCGIKSGQVSCWGADNYGQIGDGTILATGVKTATLVSGLVNPVAVQAGASHACAILASGGVRCWGYNSNGQLGDGSTTDSAVPVDVVGLTNVVQLALGQASSCARLLGGSLRCWGAGWNGVLGNGGTVSSVTPVAVTGISTATDLSMASEVARACAVVGTGTVNCWGAGMNGSLGNGGTADSSTPVAVTGITTAVQVSTGGYNSCAVLSTGSVQCWGWVWGRGDGNSGDAVTPVSVTGITTAAEVRAGYAAVCARLSGGTIQCWGYAAWNSLNSGSTADAMTPVTSLLSGSAQIVGRNNTFCSRSSIGPVQCWGDQKGAYGNGNPGTDSFASPQPMNGYSDVIDVSVGRQLACLLKSNGVPYCWGNASYIGFAGPNNQRTPTSPVTGIADAISISTGFTNGCAVHANHTVSCWGTNSYGELGDGTTTPTNTPVSVLGLSNVIKVASGQHANCALRSDRTVACWGQGTSGQLGNGVSSNSSSPVAVTGMTQAVEIAGGGNTFCALLDTGVINCWGQGVNGGLGNGGTADSSTPVTVTGITNAIQLVGVDHFCALLPNGSVKCWGLNTNGRVGDGTTTNVLTPITVAGAGPATKIIAAFSQTCAIQSTGVMNCWGLDAFNVSPSNSLLPYPVSKPTAVSQLTIGPNGTECAIANGRQLYCWGNGNFVNSGQPVNKVGFVVQAQ